MKIVICVRWRGFDFFMCEALANGTHTAALNAARHEAEMWACVLSSCSEISKKEMRGQKKQKAKDEADLLTQSDRSGGGQQQQQKKRRSNEWKIVGRPKKSRICENCDSR